MSKVQCKNCFFYGQDKKCDRRHMSLRSGKPRQCDMFAVRYVSRNNAKQTIQKMKPTTKKTMLQKMKPAIKPSIPTPQTVSAAQKKIEVEHRILKQQKERKGLWTNVKNMLRKRKVI